MNEQKVNYQWIVKIYLKYVKDSSDCPDDVNYVKIELLASRGFINMKVRDIMNQDDIFFH